MNVSGKFKLLADNNKVSKMPDAGELYYIHGCDNLSFINEHWHSLRSSGRIEAEYEKYNDLAEQNFSKAIDIMPDCANAYWKRGRCKSYRWLWYGKPKDNLAAISDYKKAIELAPTSTAVRQNLWRAYANAGKSDLAKLEFETMINLNPDWPSRKDLDREMERYNKR